MQVLSGGELSPELEGAVRLIDSETNAAMEYEAGPHALADAEQSAREAAGQTHRFFQAGRESFLADLQATRTYTDMRAQLAAANTQVAMSQIDLFLALGGGWESGRTQGQKPGKP